MAKWPLWLEVWEQYGTLTIVLGLGLGNSGGYRLAGPKLDGSSTRVCRWTLDERDVEELQKLTQELAQELTQELGAGSTQG